MKRALLTAATAAATLGWTLVAAQAHRDDIPAQERAEREVLADTRAYDDIPTDTPARRERSGDGQADDNMWMGTHADREILVDTRGDTEIWAQRPGEQARRAEIRVVEADSAVVSIDSRRARRHSPDRDAVSIRVGGYDVWLETARMSRSRRGKYEGRIGSFEIGFNNFREMPDAYNGYAEPERGFMDLRVGKSISFTWNWYTFAAPLTRDNSVGISGGVGLVSNNYRFRSANAYDVVGGKVLHPLPLESGRTLRKSKMNTFAIHFPLALEVNPTRDFFFSAGGWVDLVVGSHIKWKTPKQKLRKLSPNFFQAGMTLRVGFRHAYLFGSYSFVEMFEQARGPKLNPYTIGMGFGF